MSFQYFWVAIPVRNLLYKIPVYLVSMHKSNGATENFI